MASQKRGMTRRISVTLPEKLVARVEEYTEGSERDEFIAEALEDYLDFLDKEANRDARQAERRETLDMWLTRLRLGSKRAAEAFLP